jgi:hypothetical protein
MIKGLMVVAMITLTATTALAQMTEASDNGTDNQNKLFFGVKGGINMSKVYDSKGDNFIADSKYGFAIGGFVTIPLGRQFGIQPEVLFSQKGFISSGTYLGNTYSMTRTTDYLDIPLLVAFKPIELVTILFGPQFSYLMKQTDDFTSGTITATQEQEFTNDNIRKNIFCLTGGADLNIDPIVIGARAGWDVQNNNGDGTSTTPRYKNMWYQLTVGYRF